MALKYKYIKSDGSRTKEGERLARENQMLSLEEQHRSATEQSNRVPEIEQQYEDLASTAGNQPS